MGDIVGYTYQADYICPRCVAKIYSPDTEATTEQILDYVADLNGINRDDENTFDSGNFPKVLRREHASSASICGTCGEPLLEDEDVIRCWDCKRVLTYEEAMDSDFIYRGPIVIGYVCPECCVPKEGT